MTRAATSGASAARRPIRGTLASRLVAVGILQMCLLVVTAAIIFVVEGPHDQARPAERVDRAVVHRLEVNIDDAAGLAHELADLRANRVEASLYDADRQLIASNVEPPLAIPQRRHWGGHDHDGDGPRDFGGPFDDDRAPLAGGGPPPGSQQPPHEKNSGSGSGSGSGGMDGSALAGIAPPGGPPPMNPFTGDRFGPPDGSPHVMVIGVDVRGHRGRLVARGMPGAPPGFLGPILAIACGLVIFGLGAWLTARWIVRPIERLSRTARALGAGELTARSGLRRGDEIGELGEVVDDLADRLGTLMLAERELLANVAHELRTPRWRSRSASRTRSRGRRRCRRRARASLAEIAVDVSELQTILDDILTASRFELADAKQGAAFALRIQPTEPATLAAASADRFHARHAARTLVVDVAPGLPGDRCRSDVAPPRDRALTACSRTRTSIRRMPTRRSGSKAGSSTARSSSR